MIRFLSYKLNHFLFFDSNNYQTMEETPNLEMQSILEIARKIVKLLTIHGNMWNEIIERCTFNRDLIYNFTDVIEKNIINEVCTDLEHSANKELFYKRMNSLFDESDEIQQSTKTEDRISTPVDDLQSKIIQAKHKLEKLKRKIEFDENTPKKTKM